MSQVIGRPCWKHGLLSNMLAPNVKLRGFFYNWGALNGFVGMVTHSFDVPMVVTCQDKSIKRDDIKVL